MSLQAMVFRFVAAAAVIFIAVLVWRLGARMIFNDAADPAVWDKEVSRAGALSDATDANQSTAIPQQSDGTMRLTPSNAKLLSPQLKVESREGESAVTGWRSEADSVVWNVQVGKVADGYFRAQIRYRCQQSVRMQATVGQRRLAIWTLTETSAPAVEEKFIRLTRAGTYDLVFRPEGAAETLEILEVQLVPRKR